MKDAPALHLTHSRLAHARAQAAYYERHGGERFPHPRRPREIIAGSTLAAWWREEVGILELKLKELDR